jgi:hypothetical protein
MPYKNPDDKKKWTDEENKRRVLTGYYREYKRKHYVGDVRVDKKRQYTGKCEVCGREFNNKRGNHAYHHWDDDIPQCGVWVCCTCHNLAEGVDAGLDKVYVRLRNIVMLDHCGVTLEAIYDRQCK